MAGVSDGLGLVRAYQERLAISRSQAQRIEDLEAALETIRRDYGHVCPEFEICTHPWCASSYGAWATADEALRALTAEPEGRT